MASLKQLKELMGVLRLGAMQIPLCLALLFVCSARSMMLDVEDGNQDCVLIEAPPNSTINGNFEVLTPSKKGDVLVFLRHDDEILYHEEVKVRDYFRKKAETGGFYELCFMNGGVGGAKRAKLLADFRLSSDPHGPPADSNGYTDDEDDDDGGNGKEPAEDDGGGWSGSSISDDLYAPGYKKTIGFGLRLEEEAVRDGEEGDELQKRLREAAETIERKMINFKDHERNIRARERRHGDNMSTSTSRLMWYAFIEATVLLVVSWWQVSYIRRFFETKRAI